MPLYKVYTIEGTYLGQMAATGIEWLFSVAPNVTISIHGGDERILSGEYSRFDWDDAKSNRLVTLCDHSPKQDEVARALAAASWKALD
jgi:hypothetical protein